MEAPKKKVTAKLSSQSIVYGTNSSNNPSIPPSPSPSPHVVVRAKISSTSRVNFSNTPTSSLAIGGANSNVNGALRPHASATARRSPSPAKMRPGSPSKLQPHLRPQTSRTPLIKAATMIPHADRTRQGSICSVLQASSTPNDPSGSTATPPTTSPPRRDTNNMLNGDSGPSVNIDSGSGSFRIKSKVSGLAKPAPSLSTILSPPSPSSLSSSPALSTNRPLRPRATTLAARRPSISFSVSQPTTSLLSPEPPQLIPLPTSPPASTLSFSSHSSLSSSSAHSCSTSTGLSLTFTNHARSESSPISTFNMQVKEDPSSSHDEPPASPPPQRTLIARVRPGTRISGGRTSGSSVAGEREFCSSSGVRMAELDDRSTDESERSDHESRKRKPQTVADDDPEDNVRAEAKSNRKIADLEITTRSLLTINSALEASKLRQAREIRELRRKLRETRLAMPPGRFRLLNEQDKTGGGDKAAEEEESDEDEEETGEGNECDESFKRVKILVEDLLVAGRSALDAPAPSSSLSNGKGIGSPSSVPGNKLGLGIDSGPVGGTRMDQGEVLGWDVGSSLGTDSSSNACKESGSRQWKHGVAIGSKVLSPEEAKLWVGEDGVKEREEECQNQVEGDKIQHEPDGTESLATEEDATDSYGDIEPAPATH